MTNWATVYIIGRGDFREEVLRRIENSSLDAMPGYTELPLGTAFYDFYWVSEAVSLRELKATIGSKLIWKYRLRFYSNLQTLIGKDDEYASNNAFTEEELDLMASMRKAG